MNADVEKAVERDWSVALENAGLLRAMSKLPGFANASYMADQLTGLCADHRVMTHAMRDQEAEIARLRKIEEERWSVVATRNAAVMRAEKAEALLRKTLRYLDPRQFSEVIARITAHLGDEHE